MYNYNITAVYICNTKNPLNYGNLSPQNRIYQSFCGDFFSIILMIFIISRRFRAIYRRAAHNAVWKFHAAEKAKVRYAKKLLQTESSCEFCKVKLSEKAGSLKNCRLMIHIRTGCSCMPSRAAAAASGRRAKSAAAEHGLLT